MDNRLIEVQQRCIEAHRLYTIYNAKHVIVFTGEAAPGAARSIAGPCWVAAFGGGQRQLSLDTQTPEQAGNSSKVSHR